MKLKAFTETTLDNRDFPFEAVACYEPEYLWLECATCNEEFDIIVESPEQIDMCIRESGHEGHNFAIYDYEPEHPIFLTGEEI